MDIKAFEQRFMKIITTFGAKNYSQDRVSIIFHEVKNFSASDFERVVSHLIGNQRVAPLVAEFRRTISDLGLRPERKLEIVEATSHQVYPENFLYHLEGNAWADNYYIYLRGTNIRECSFVVKADQPHHPLVLLDEQIREQRIKEAKEHIKNKTYPKFEESKNSEMRRLHFPDFTRGPA